VNFRIILLPQAEADILQISDWIYERTPVGADTWIRKWLDVLEYLESHADGCGLAPEDDRHDLEIRQVLFRTRRRMPYRAIFRIADSDVFVYRIRGAGQDVVSPDDLIPPDATTN